jgi:hypothetical protein
MRANISKSSTRQKHVFFRPGVDLIAMRAGEAPALLRGSRPKRFVNGFADWRQFGGCRASDEETTDRALRFPGGWWFKVKTHY